MRDPAPRPLVRRPTDMIAAACVAVIITCSVTGECGRFWWFFDLFSHFQLQYLVVLLASIIWFSIRRRRRALTITAIAAVWPLLLVGPLYTDSGAYTTQPANCKVVSTNVYAGNSGFERVIQFASRESADLLFFQEVTPAWAKRLNSLSADLPYAHVQPRSDAFGIALFSRHPLQGVRTITIGDVPWIRAEALIRGQRVVVIGAHTLPPVSRTSAAIRNQQLRDLQTEVVRLQRQDVPVLVVGDLNCSPWSAHLGTLIRNTGLTSARRGFGVLPTWPRQHLPLRIPIDHVLMSSHFSVADFRVGPDVGSDHFPVLAELRLKDR